LVCGVLAVLLAIASASIVQVLTLFYTVLTVVLFVPIVGGLYVSRTTTRQVWPATAAGVLTMLVMQFVAGDSGWGVVTPALGGLLSAIAVWAIGLAFSSPVRAASPTLH
jgi:Na+/proline symporter